MGWWFFHGLMVLPWVDGWNPGSRGSELCFAKRASLCIVVAFFIGIGGVPPQCHHMPPSNKAFLQELACGPFFVCRGLSEGFSGILGEVAPAIFDGSWGRGRAQFNGGISMNCCGMMPWQRNCGMPGSDRGRECCLVAIKQSVQAHSFEEGLKKGL